MEEVDWGADGTMDDRRTYTYDDAGNLTLKEEDTYADGLVERSWTYTQG